VSKTLDSVAEAKMTSRLLLVSPLSLLAAALSACTPQPKEEVFVQPTTRTPCWFSPNVPAGTRVIADVPFDEPENSKRMPSESDKAIVRALGGRVLHVFNVPMLRIEIDTSAIPALLYRLNARILLPVADTSKRDVITNIFYNGPARPEDSARVAALGVRMSGSRFSRMISVVAADSIIPAIRKLPYVVWVRPMSGACVVSSPPRIARDSTRARRPPDPKARRPRDPKVPIRVVHEVATHPWPGEDYSPWIKQIESTGRGQIPGAVPYDSASRAFRLVVIKLPQRTTLLIEEVRYGLGGCCARVASVREVELQSLFQGYEARNAFDELRIVGAPPYMGFRIGLEQMAFEIADITEEPLRFVRIREER
jgi:hypothetical protein